MSTRARSTRQHALSVRLQVTCTHLVLWSVLVVLPLSLDRFVLPKLTVQFLAATIGIGAAASNDSLRWSKPLAALLGLIGVLAVSSLISASPATALLGTSSRRLGVLSWLLLAGLFALGSAYSGVRKVSDLAWSMVGAGSIVAIVTVCQTLTSQGGARPTSTLGTATSTGLIIAVTFVLTVGGLIRTQRRWRVALGIAVLVQTSALLLSGARGAWLGAGLGLAFLASASMKDLSWTRRGAAIAVVVLATAILVVLLPGVRARTSTLLAPTEGTAGGRIALLGVGLSAFTEKPLLGWGADLGRPALHAHLTEGFEGRYGDRRIEDRVHNTVLDFAVWGGAIGVVALGIFVTAVAVGLRRGRQVWWIQVTSAVAIVYAAHLFFNFPNPDSDAVVWLLVGAAVPVGSITLRAPSWAAAIVGVSLVAAVLPPLIDGLESEVRMNSGADAEVRGDIEGAERLYRAAVAAHGSARTYEVLSRFGLRVGHADLAADAANAATRLDPSDPYLTELSVQAMSELARQRRDSTLAQKAVATARILVAASPWDGSLHLVLGNACIAAHDPTCALAEYLKATEITPSRPEAWHNLGTVQLATGQRAEAVASLRHALALDPDNRKVRDQLAALGAG